MLDHPSRILVTKPGLDGHDRGIKIVARILRDAGYEVIVTGIRQTVAQITQMALQEDVDAIGLSILSGAHLPLTKRVLDDLREHGLNDIPVFVGGTIPASDVAALKALGAAAIFPTGSTSDDIIDGLARVLQAS